MTDPITLLSALSEPTRLEAIRILWDGGEHCVCELMDRLGASQSRMSRHMAVLKAVGLVADRRDAQWVRYRLKASMSPGVRTVIQAVMALPVPADHVRSAA